MNEPFRIRHARPIVITSTLAILSVVALIALVRYNRANTTKNVYLIYADQEQVRGIKKYMDVKILGEPVGVVDSVKYREGHPSHVQIQFTVNNPDVHRIRTNSRVIVARTLAVGSAFLEIERATDMLGMVVTNLTNEERKRERATGVRVVGIADGSPAAMFRERLEGKFITQINGEPVTDISTYYKLMDQLVEARMVDVGLLNEDDPVSLNAALVTTHPIVEDGGIVYQFEPEKSSIETITEQLGAVQESIATVEGSMVNSLAATDASLLNDVAPTFKSITKTSDALREDTAVRANKALDKSHDTLKRVDKSSETVSTEVERVADRVVELCDDDATPAFNKFGKAAESLETTSHELRKTVDEVGGETSEAIEKLTTAILTLQDVLERSREVVEVLQKEADDLPGTAKRINGTMQNLNTTVSKAQTTIDGINNHWLLKHSIKRSQNQKNGQAKKSGPIREFFHR